MIVSLTALNLIQFISSTSSRYCTIILTNNNVHTMCIKWGGLTTVLAYEHPSPNINFSKLAVKKMSLVMSNIFTLGFYRLGDFNSTSAVYVNRTTRCQPVYMCG